MPENEDYVMRPVLAGMIDYYRLLDGSISLLDIARMNDALDVKAENEHRAYAAMNKT